MKKPLVPREYKITNAIVGANPPKRKNRPKIKLSERIPTKHFVVPTNKYIEKKAKQRITLAKVNFKDMGEEK